MSDRPPPVHLSRTSRAIWRALVRRWYFNDADFVALGATLEALDRLSQAREQIDADGLILGGKAHPLLQLERDCRQAVMRGVRLLKLEDAEPLKGSIRRVS